MDIQIKHREVDKRAKMRDIVIAVAKDSCGNHIPDVNTILNAVHDIDKLYKEESKEIEVIKVYNDDVTPTIGYLSDTKQLIMVVKTDKIVGTQLSEAFNK